MTHRDADPGDTRPRSWLAPTVIVAVIMTVAVLFVLSSLRRPSIDTYVVTEPVAVEVGTALVGPLTYTLDASHASQWTHFDFSRGSVVAPDDPVGWDLAFRRFSIMANGGVGFPGSGGIIDLGPVAFDSVLTVPESGYFGTDAQADSSNAAIERWYDYGFTSHILRSKRHVYGVRTADGRYALLQIIGYYCAGATPGCVTFRYSYQGDGTPSLRAVEPATPLAADSTGT